MIDIKYGVVQNLLHMRKEHIISVKKKARRPYQDRCRLLMNVHCTNRDRQPGMMQAVSTLTTLIEKLLNQ